ncbi:flagellar hook-associated protein 3 [Lysobacter sp. TY2-98]|uniref:flagellar hook-associated protein FlgL n=1 Tax=Lysobacter sp. TY2-98 TaxID=2290922 RepID=UPI000E20159C|nr:flagellar hook-associated protein FlgL [Lysobacter sp. TY2-98]AXK71288.1 flagellar hook-associated protein 3 [Lysobacter sp. TY2-98]
MRISTSGLYQQGLAALMRHQTDISKTQQQLATGVKLTRAADDPAGMAQAQRIDYAVSQLDNFEKSAGLLQNRLQAQEAALSDGNDYLTRVRELVVQANNGTMSDYDRQMAASEIRHLRASLIDVANRNDGNGRSLFAGQRDGVVPFSDAAGVVTYNGDDGQNRVEVSADMALADADPGSAVFMRARTGDGTIRASATAANTGTGVLQSTSVTDPAAWNGRTLTLEFTAPGAWRVLDGATVVGSGTYTDGDTLQVAGIKTRLTGAPATGDTFTLQSAPRQDVFTTLQTLADALETPTITAQQKAQNGNAMTTALSDITAAQEHFLSVRATTGARLASLDQAADDRSGTALSLKDTLSGLRDTDYAEASTRLSLQMTAIEAAQKTMLRVQSMSLFDKL